MMMMHPLHLSHLRAGNTTTHRKGTKPCADPYEGRSQNWFSHAQKPNRSRFLLTRETTEPQKNDSDFHSPVRPYPHMPSTPLTPEASLHRPLRLRDLVLTQVLCVVGSSWVGIAAGLG